MKPENKITKITKDHLPMHVAFLGSRGIPNTYGGFELAAEMIGVKLVEKGFRVTVYGLAKKGKKIEQYNYHGVECINFRAPDCRQFQKIYLSLKAVAHALRMRPDVIIFLGVSAALFIPLVSMFRIKTILNPDGLEWKRRKWGRIGRLYLKISEWIAVKSADFVIADSEAIRAYLKKTYAVDSEYISYGADIIKDVPSDYLKQIGLEPGEYMLQSCRLEPDNNVELVIEAYLKSARKIPLVIIGDATDSEYLDRLRMISGDRIRFSGAVYGPEYLQIVGHCALYVHAHEVGGTNPSLLQAMALAKAPLYLDVPFNREVAGDAGFPFKKNPQLLAEEIDVLSEKLHEVEMRGIRAREIIRERYLWEPVADKYASLLREHGMKMK